MIILGIESSSLVASVALVRDERMLAEFTTDFKRTHSQTLLPMLEEIMRITGLTAQDLDAVAVSSGPGSFTGLRIGAATAKGICFAIGKPLIAVSTLEAMAWNIAGGSDIICPIMDAKREQVYTGIYIAKNGQLCILSDQRAIGIEQLIAELNAMERRVVFLGDGVPVYMEYIQKHLHTEFYFAPAHLSRQRAGAVAVLGEKLMEQGRVMNAADFVPEYLRKSQAEREAQERGLIR